MFSSYDSSQSVPTSWFVIFDHELTPTPPGCTAANHVILIPPIRLSCPPGGSGFDVAVLLYCYTL